MSALSDELRIQGDGLILDTQAWGGTTNRLYGDGTRHGIPTAEAVIRSSGSLIAEGKRIRARLADFFTVINEHSAWDAARDSGAIAQGVRVGLETERYQPALDASLSATGEIEETSITLAAEARVAHQHPEAADPLSWIKEWIESVGRSVSGPAAALGGGLAIAGIATIIITVLVLRKG